MGLHEFHVEGGRWLQRTHKDVLRVIPVDRHQDPGGVNCQAWPARSKSTARTVVPVVKRNAAQNERGHLTTVKQFRVQEKVILCIQGKHIPKGIELILHPGLPPLLIHGRVCWNIHIDAASRNEPPSIRQVVNLLHLVDTPHSINRTFQRGIENVHIGVHDGLRKGIAINHQPEQPTVGGLAIIFLKLKVVNELDRD
ncbi:hypothetical protein TraAM80_05642 [Trypanosoma rangeli]|uniref:Uncharacterized protein n=1 Tax=Trypanosoma rangeli TaxID=5698 RepID=A0A3R7NAZ5_TRYRA|nr:uncharacterized protein TraAM80_05642 [Trypanosoma rangeli]RNF03481.1 hypothetical protein TraAM80_05642 [Trypanosoma rangeli]|eukprot:RNF03481.1 hypothetical protein TraAM80_05642 [Trypanosoma rangeli]